MKSVMLFMTALLAVLLLVVGGWSLLPVEVDRSVEDPAVEYLNPKANANAQFKAGYFEHRDQQLHYVEAGKGELVVFLHGFPSYWLSFLQQLTDLSADYHVLAIDGLGVGRSSVSRDLADYQLEAMKDHLLALIDSKGVQGFHLVGHDWGAVFAFSLAQRLPERVLSVTGISAPPLNVLLKAMTSSDEQREATAYIESLKKLNAPLIAAANGSARTVELYEKMAQSGSLNQQEADLFSEAVANAKRIDAHINWYRVNIPAPEDIEPTHYWPEQDRALSMPSLFIYGDSDPIFTTDLLDIFQQDHPATRVLMLDDTGHWPHLERVGAVNHALRSLLANKQQTN